jgi:hypothetical protein
MEVVVVVTLVSGGGLDFGVGGVSESDSDMMGL